MSVTVHTATVYKTSARGRRYFSKRQAFIADAFARLKKKYDPDGVIDELIGGDHHQTSITLVNSTSASTQLQSGIIAGSGCGKGRWRNEKSKGRQHRPWRGRHCWAYT